jgi:hypothetical protein
MWASIHFIMYKTSGYTGMLSCEEKSQQRGGFPADSISMRILSNTGNAARADQGGGLPAGFTCGAACRYPRLDPAPPCPPSDSPICRRRSTLGSWLVLPLANSRSC